MRYKHKRSGSAKAVREVAAKSRIVRIARP